MGIKELPYKKLETLIKKYLSKDEHEGTAELIEELKNANKRKYITKNEMIEICRWKSPRAIHHIKSNSENKIKTITKKVFSTNYEKERLSLLMKLKGVSVPMASSVLMLTNPRRYGVIDIRVWQLLYKIGTVKNNPDGIGFSFKVPPQIPGRKSVDGVGS